jgi:RNA polymerase sigma-70 factor (ECF subfamily)
MSTASLDTLLEKLAKGESAAAERVFRDFEPFLRAMVRRRLTPPLRVKFDSMDVVQSVWADILDELLEGGREFKDQAHLRAFLARVTYHHFVNQCRRHGTALKQEQPLLTDDTAKLPASPQPRPSEVAQAGELWDTLMDLCPPAHRQILELKRQGFSLEEIANRVGLHEGSVRRIIYELARRLASTKPTSSAP